MIRFPEQKAHFLGIGGMGMTPLALYLSEAGWEISGEDRHLPESCRLLLESRGIRIEDFNTWTPPPGLLVLSSAVGQTHPLLIRSQEAGSRIWRRGALLAEMLKDRKVLAVVGSHGKTTTAAMIVHLLRRMRIDAGYLVGGLFTDPSIPPAHYGRESEWVVVEVDESDGTIERFSPEITLALNMDWDHADHYRVEREQETTFARLFEKTRLGVVVHAGGRMEALARQSGGLEIRTFGEGGDLQYQLRDSTFDRVRMSLKGSLRAEALEVRASGSFNARNAVAALAVVNWMAGRVDLEALATFPGVNRRQQQLFGGGSVSIWEDYAHHPTEIKEWVSAVSANHPAADIHVVFQPHRYSRTQVFKRELAQALTGADRLFLLPVYAASETPLAGGMLEDLEQACRDIDLEPFLPEPGPELYSMLRDSHRKTSVVLFIGAGDISEQAAGYACILRHPGDLQQQWHAYVKDRISRNTHIALDEPLHNKTTIRIGGKAMCYAEPASVSDLRVCLLSARLLGLPLFVLGRGSNLIVPDEGFSGLVLRFQHETWRRIEPIEGDRIFVGAGVRLRDLASHTAREEMSGFEFMEGIPGSLGGSLRMNAGAMGSWMFDVVERVLLMQPDGKVLDLDRSAFQVGYRSVEELKSALALGAVLKSPSREETPIIKERMQEYMLTRKASQPREPSAGCIFKNPEGDAAGRLIDVTGLKGLREGGAEVSTLHGNFIINRGDATSRDVIRLVRKIRSRIQEAHGIELEPEVLLLGERWEEVLSGD